MTNNEYQQLARDFLDLWQKQMGAVIRDKQFIRAMLEMTQNLQNTDGNAKKPASAANAAGAAHAGHGDLAHLAFRIGMCEQRLAALEQGASKSAARPGRAGKTDQRGKRRGKKPRK